MVTATPANSGRKQDGTFAPGASGNPAGKAKGTRHRATRAIEELLEGEHEALTRAAIDKAKEGDVPALRLCLERIAPARKDSPIVVDLPSVETAADLVRASASVVASVTSGDLTPDEGNRLMALLVAHKSVVEAGDLERRIAELEARSGVK